MPEATQKAAVLHFDALKHLPDEWRAVPVGCVLEGSQYGLNIAADQEGDVPIVGMKDIVNGHVKTDALATVRVKGGERASHTLSRGDILINRTNSYDLVGKVGLYDSDIEAVFASYLVRLRIKRDLIDPWFLTYWLNHPIAQHTIKRIATRAVGQANVNPTEFKKYCVIPLPPLSEQRRIAAGLRSWDEAIETTGRLMGVRERQHAALTNQLVFGQRRLGNFVKSSEKTGRRWFDLPSDWQVAPIGKLAREISERNGENTAGEVLSCSKYDGFVRSLDYFKKQIFSADLSAYKKIWRGDFGFPSNHIEEGSIGLQDLVDIGLVSPIYTVFRFHSKRIDNVYAFGVLKTSLYRHLFEVSTSASVDRRGSLRWSEFAKIPFPIPSLAEQRAISTVLTANRDLIDQLKAERDALDRQKRGLMQKLLTGEWRIDLDMRGKRVGKEVAE